ncbi:MAG TPA: ATP-binding protein, partial [Streptosporangiaceae bacterium]
EADNGAPREARRFVREHLEKLGHDRAIDDAELVVSELVTNSVAAAPGTVVFVALLPVSGQVILEVWDLSPKTPVLRPPDIMATEGRGLRIVEELSVNFGCNRKGRWKVVWALLGAD